MGQPTPSDARLELLLNTLGRVAISVDLEPTLSVLLDSLRELVPFDAGGIFVRDEDSALVRVRATRGYPDDLALPATNGIVGDVLRNGQPRLVGDVRHEPLYVALRSSTSAQLTVPLSSPRGILGAISLEADRPSAFEVEDLSIAILFAQQATVVIERALMHAELMRQSRLTREIEIARQILQNLTPSQPPVLPGVQIAGRSMTASSVGGDAFDFISYPDTQLGVSISDAKGKGLPAALLALAHQAMLKSLVSVELRLRATFSRMSDLIASSVPSGDFITTFYGIVDVAERRMVYVNAGHVPPLLIRASGASEWLATTGPALGFPRVAPFREAYAAFGDGDGLVLFTDGVTDVGPSPDEFFDVTGLERTTRALWSYDARQICEGVLKEVVRCAGGTLPDDATVVVVKFS